MSDRFKPITREQLTNWIFDELEANAAIFGIPEALVYRPSEAAPYQQTLYGDLLETPFGVAAGPHSQMAQNIVVAWLCGARFMELKTVQTLDELDITKPCIDMQDEGYNVEWSQELAVEQSFEEYLRAWVLIHALHRKLGFPGDRPGVIFNMSVGYDFAGIQKPNMQWYLDRMEDAGEDLAALVEVVAKRFPEIRELVIPARMANSVTLSTMHGCPPGEIGEISEYLIRERGLHTSVKMNPTLIGPERARGILNQELGFDEITIPDQSFEHDLEYPDALELIGRLRGAAEEEGVVFGLKLSNTLEVLNHRPVFDAGATQMYMSGRPLHAMAVNLASQLADDVGPDLLMSFAGGADCFNVPHLLRGGMATVTTCSDILRSGGYLRLLQYLETTAEAMKDAGAGSLDAFRKAAAADPSWLPLGFREDDEEAPEGAAEAGRLNLRRYARAVLRDRTLQRETFDRHHSKTPRELGLFDCIEAPCVDECAIDQKVPQYMGLVRRKRFEEAVTVTRMDNPLAAILGRCCDHVCEDRCIRTHYDEPLAIREIKRFITAHEFRPGAVPPAERRDEKVAVIGGGPCGLAVAYFLARVGFPVTVFEAHDYPGGMVTGTIPLYRSPQQVMEQDLAFLKPLGVEVRCGQRAGRDFTLKELRDQEFEHVVVAVGAQAGLQLGIEGEDGQGVLEGLEFLREVRHGEAPDVGRTVGVIGGGDVAMDCARTALRLGAKDVVVIYRRSTREMPAQREEVADLLDEGARILELVSPKSVVREGNRFAALVGNRMELGEPDDSGRRRPVEIPGAEERIELDTLITAIGQRADLALFGEEAPERTRKGYLDVDPVTYETSIPGVYAGGDVAQQGPSSIVKAMGDGRRIAEGILHKQGLLTVETPEAAEIDRVELLRRRARREYRTVVPHRTPEERIDFSEYIETFSEDQAVAEAARCLDCHRICSLCTSVCPNLAFVTYEAEPLERELPVWKVEGGKLEETLKERFAIGQGLQVAVLTDFCNECGNCATFCPTSGEPYRDKPRLYLDRAEFEAQQDNAFMLTREGEGWRIEGRFAGALHRLVLGDELRYSSPALEATLRPDTLDVVEVKVGEGAEEGAAVGLGACATLYALGRSVRSSLSYLPAAS